MDREDFENIIFDLASEFYPDYPDPMPEFQYLGGNHGINLLESALAQPQQVFDGKYLYRTIFDKAAAMFFSLVKNHSLVDGNKRLALTSLAVFLTLNDYAFYLERDEAVSFTVKLASGDELDISDVSKWIRKYSIRVDRLLSMSYDEGNQWMAVEAGSLTYSPRLNELLKEYWLGEGNG